MANGGMTTNNGDAKPSKLGDIHSAIIVFPWGIGEDESNHVISGAFDKWTPEEMSYEDEAQVLHELFDYRPVHIPAYATPEFRDAVSSGNQSEFNEFAKFTTGTTADDTLALYIQRA